MKKIQNVWAWLQTPKGRKTTYKTLVVVGAALTTFGVANKDTVDVVLAQAGTILGLGVAHYHVPPQD